VERMATTLTALGVNTAPYHAGLPKKHLEQVCVT
jgi:superfamily II helicase